MASTPKKEPSAAQLRDIALGVRSGLTPQAALVLDYLTSGRKITNLVAHMTLGVASLTARIAELRAVMDPEAPAKEPRRLYDIKDQWDSDHFNRRYKSYWMVVDPAMEAPHA